MKAGPPSRLGPYEILGPLGAGGMGEVYRARDVRLQREVAVKILPESAASNPDRHRRFAQEAIAAGALNHPNILIVHDVGVEGDVAYLVSELVDGTPLGQEMLRGRMPLKRLLDIGLQIAEGLRAAHDAGIAHRDLKPDNVMITRDDRVKILDFGLAKMLDGDDGDVVSTLGSTQTAAGVLLGTVAYMSPEQARGARIDFRTDQFSLGVILTEIVTGAHPFKRETGVQTLAAIIDDEAPDLTQTIPAVPVPLRWVIQRLLAKEPRERYAHTADMVADLRTLRDRLSEAAPGIVAPVGERTRGRAWRWAAASLVFAIGSFAIGRLLAPNGTDLTAYRFTPWATDAGYQGAPAFSPDGKAIAYVAEVAGVLQVFTRSLASSRRSQLTHSRFDCHDPFWAPDGNRVYYHSRVGYNEALFRVSLAGGSPEKVMDLAARAAISPDGQTLAVLRDDPDRPSTYTLWFSSPAGAEQKKYTRAPFENVVFDDGYLRFSPDSSKLLMWLMRDVPDRGQTPQTGFWMLSMPDGVPQLVMPSLAGLRAPPLFSWFPGNRHIVMARSDGRTSGSHLWVADTSNDVAWPLTVTNGNEASPAVSPDGGTIALTSESTDFDLALVPVDGSGIQPWLSSTRNELDPAWSSARAEYAFVTDRTGTQEISLRSEEGDWERPLVTNTDFGGSSTIALGALAFSPDGQRLAYQRFSAEGYRIWISPTAGGRPVQLTSTGFVDAPTWSPDGEWIAFIGGTEAPGDLAKVRVGAGATTPVVLKRRMGLFSRPRWSRDGRWILCQAPDGLTLIAADGQASRIISEDDWLAYDWSADGSTVYGLQATEDLHHFALVSVDLATGRQRVLNPNLGGIPQANQPIRGFSRVGNRAFAISIARVRSDIWLFDGFQSVARVWSRLWPFGAFRGPGGERR